MSQDPVHEDQLALSKRSAKKKVTEAAKQQVQPPEAGLKRFKTQDGDKENPESDGQVSRKIRSGDAESDSLDEETSQ